MLGVYTEMQIVEGDMATVNPEALDALNALLEDQRASVEIDVALVMGATERAERDTLATMGSEDVLACVTLREHLEQANAPVSLRINGIVLAVLDTERYDDRLRAYVDLHTAICEQVSELLPQTADQELRVLLQEMYAQHRRGAEWCAQRADAFDYSRTLDFRAPRRTQTGDAQHVSDPHWEPLEPLPTPETNREPQTPQPPHDAESHPEWYGDDAANERPGAPGSDAWQDADPPNRRSRYQRANEMRVDSY